MSDINAANIPGASPLTDSNGQITMVWYQFLLALFNRTGGSGTPPDIGELVGEIEALGKEIGGQAVPLPFRGTQQFNQELVAPPPRPLTFLPISNITRLVQDKLRETVSVKDFGAAGDGVKDDTAAIQAAINSGALDIFIPSGTYITSSTLLVATNFQQLRGAGSYQTIIKSNALAAGGIAIQTGMTGCKVVGLQIAKSLGTTTVGNGMAMLGTSENVTLEDIRVSGFFNGFVLGTTDFGYVRKCVSTMNWKAGFDISNASTYGPVQWQLEDTIAAQNNYHGYYLHSNTGVPGMVMGAWSGIQTYANNGYGFIAVGSAGCPIFDIRLNNFFFGNDNLGSVYLDTKGYNNRMDVGMIEESGRGLSGPTLGTTNSNAAAGVHIGPSEVDFAISNTSIFNSSLCGIESFGGDIAISGCNINNSGLNPLAGVGGVVVHAGAAVINGGRNKSNIYGIVVDGTGGVVASGGDYRGNQTAATIGITTTNSKITGCFPLTMNN